MTLTAWCLLGVAVSACLGWAITWRRLRAARRLRGGSSVEGSSGQSPYRIVSEVAVEAKDVRPAVLEERRACLGLARAVHAAAGLTATKAIVEAIEARGTA